MAIKIISDVHGEYAALRDVLDEDDTAILLGDYLNLIDFKTLEGILSEVYTREEILSALAVLKKGPRNRAGPRTVQALSGGGDDRRARVGELVREGYEEFFKSIPCRSYMIYGNTDNPWLMKEYHDGAAEIVESGVVEVEGTRFGLVSGTPRTPWTIGLPGELEDEEYRKRLDSLGPVDVLCTHYPPAVPDLTWDLQADRDEEGSADINAYIERHRPDFHYFGHVHHPRSTSGTLGETVLVNAGFFREHHEALVFRS